MSTGLLLFTTSVLIMIAFLPIWPYNRSKDLRPSAGFALIGAFAVLLMSTGRL